MATLVQVRFMDSELTENFWTPRTHYQPGWFVVFLQPHNGDWQTPISPLSLRLTLTCGIVEYVEARAHFSVEDRFPQLTVKFTTLEVPRLEDVGIGVIAEFSEHIVGYRYAGWALNSDKLWHKDSRAEVLQLLTTDHTETFMRVAETELE